MPLDQLRRHPRAVTVAPIMATTGVMLDGFRLIGRLNNRVNAPTSPLEDRLDARSRARIRVRRALPFLIRIDRFVGDFAQCRLGGLHESR